MRHPDHLDEGTIHAWLDGALSAAEADAAAAHAAGCAACAAAVAEARGLVAAASRILAKLDDVPGRVLPGSDVAPADAGVTPIEAARARATAAAAARVAGVERQRRRLATLGAAAAVLFLSVGTFAVVHERERGGARDSFGLAARKGEGVGATASQTLRTEAAVSAPRRAGAPLALDAPAAAPPAPPPREAREAPHERRRDRAKAAAPLSGGVASSVGTLEDSAAAPRAEEARRDAADVDRAERLAIAPRAATAVGPVPRGVAAAPAPVAGARAVTGAEREGELARASPRPNAPERVAGCYELELGGWKPAGAATFADRGAFPVPRRVALDTTRSPAPMDYGFGVRDATSGDASGRGASYGGTAGAASGGPRPYSYWTPIGADSVRIVWGDGAAGVDVRARVERGGLRGTAATFSDDDRRPVQRSDARARRVGCGAGKG